MSPTRKLPALLLMTVASSVVHYADNIVRFAAYPEPPWLNPTRVDLFWFVMTPFAVAAFLYARRGRARRALGLAVAYAGMNLLVLGHYLVLPPWRMAWSINFGIFLEAIAAVWLLAYATLGLRGGPREGVTVPEHDPHTRSAPHT
jgi:hypothetical protein